MDSSQSVEKVCQILSQHGFSGDVVQGFRDEKMDGEAVCAALSCSAGPDCLKNVVKKTGPRLKVYAALKQLQSCGSETPATHSPERSLNISLLNISLVGYSCVGKTLLASQYCKAEATSNNLFTKQLMEKDTTIHINIWESQSNPDTGAADCREEVDCCIMVYDVTRSDSCTNLDVFKEEFLKQRKPRDPSTFLFVVIGNKLDLLDEQAEKELQLKVRKWCENNNSLYFEISAKDVAIVEKTFDEIVRKTLASNREIEEDNPYANPCKQFVKITCWVNSKFDLGDQRFSDDDLKALSEEIALSDTGDSYDILVKREECYRRCYTTGFSETASDQEHDSEKQDKDKVVITVQAHTDYARKRACKFVSAHYKGGIARVILEPNSSQNF